MVKRRTRKKPVGAGLDSDIMAKFAPDLKAGWRAQRKRYPWYYKKSNSTDTGVKKRSKKSKKRKTKRKKAKKTGSANYGLRDPYSRTIGFNYD